MRKRAVIYFCCFVMCASFLGIYFKTHVNIWGHYFSKSDLKSIIIYSKDKTYIVSNHKKVVSIAEELSRMERETKINSLNYPPQNSSNKLFSKILIQTNNNTNYGGAIWSNDNKIIQASNGYYWTLDNKKIGEVISSSLKTAKRRI